MFKKQECSLETNLGGKEKAQVAASEAVLDTKGHFLRQAQVNLGGQSGSLAKIDQVLEGKGQSNRLAKLDGNILLGLIDVGVLADSNRTVANVALTRELDAFLCGLNDDFSRVSLRKSKGQHLKMNIPDSDSAFRSRQIRWNSAAGIETVAAYSVSGMARCSWSISISLMSYSLRRSVSALSNMRLTTSGESSALSVKISSFWAARRTLVKETKLMPSAMLRSHRYGEKPSAFISMETRATCELSMACRAMPESLQSKLQS